MSPEVEAFALNKLFRVMARPHKNNALFVGGTFRDHSDLLVGLSKKMNKAGNGTPFDIRVISGDKASLETFLASPAGTRAFILKDMNDLISDPETEYLVKRAMVKPGGIIGYATTSEAMFRDPGMQRRMIQIDLTTPQSSPG